MSIETINGDNTGGQKLIGGNNIIITDANGGNHTISVRTPIDLDPQDLIYLGACCLLAAEVNTNRMCRPDKLPFLDAQSCISDALTLAQMVYNRQDPTREKNPVAKPKR